MQKCGVHNLRYFALQLQTKTFNILRPLLNPAGAFHFILGVADATCLATMADTLKKLNCGKSVIVHGLGMDGNYLCRLYQNNRDK
jgi:anthranilate phosphoribosyltransferase